MQSLLRYAAGFLFFVLFSPSCAFDDEDVTSCILEEETGGAISVFVSCGDPTSRPIYSWGLTPVQIIRVEKGPDFDTLVWQIISKTGQDTINSSVQHGVDPVDTIPAGTELDLITGVNYRVTVTQQDGITFGFRKFSILP